MAAVQDIVSMFMPSPVCFASGILPIYENDKETLNYSDLRPHRFYIAESLNYYLQRLPWDEASLYMKLDREKKIALRHRLLTTYYLLCAQMILDEQELRKSNLRRYEAYKNLCQELLDKLVILDNPAGVEPPQQQLDLEIPYDKPCNYLGLCLIAPWFAQKMVELASGTAQTTKAGMGELNTVRLYWVWTGSLLEAILRLIPATFHNQTQAYNAVIAPARFAGYVSWVLYFTRFGIDLFLFLKHCEGPLMTEKEAAIPRSQRWKTQWELRKFTLLNDFIWGLANLACFFWLYGTGAAGYWGNITVALLLIADLSLVIWRFAEESTRHNKRIADLEATRDRLNGEINQLAETDAKRKALEAERNEINDALAQAKFDWKFQERQLFVDVAYSLGLFVSFGIMSAWFACPVSAIPTFVALAGGALCFLFTIAYPAVKGGLEVEKSKQKLRLFEKQIPEANPGDPNADNNAVLLEAQRQYHLDMIDYQRKKLIRGVFVDALMPVIILGAFLFVPMGGAIAIFAVAVALGVYSKWLIEQQEPQPPKITAPQLIGGGALPLPAAEQQGGQADHVEEALPAPPSDDEGVGEELPPAIFSEEASLASIASI